MMGGDEVGGASRDRDVPMRWIFLRASGGQYLQILSTNCVLLTNP